MNRKLLIILLAVVVLSASLALFACGEDSVIDYIELYSSPKAVYTEGETFDISNASIRVVYNDGSEEIVQITPDMVSGFNPNTIGKQYLKIYYEGSSTTFVVTVQREAVVSVVPFIPEGQTDYIEGQNLNLTGAYLMVTYANNVTEKIDITEDMISGFDKDVVGEQDVYVTCDINGEEYVHTFRVNVVEKEIDSIEIDTLPTKSIYYLGDEINLIGGVLFVRYNSGYSEKISMTDAQGKAINGLEATYDFTQVNNKSFVTITYGYKTTRFSVAVKIRDIADYEILVAPKEQIQNLELDMTGTVIKVTYNNGESENITLPSEQIRVEGYDKTNASELYQTAVLVFSYGGVELATRGSIRIKIVQEEAVGIEIVQKATIYQDTDINPDVNWKYILVYNNGNRSQEYDFNSSMIDWGNATAVNSYSEVGKQTWHVVYSSEIDTYFEFEVKALEVVEIEFVGEEGAIAYLGGNVVIDGITMNVTYNNGSTITGVALDKSMITFDNTTVGVKIVTVNYSDKYDDSFIADFYATVVKKVNNITLTQAPKSQYVLHETFDPTELIIEVNYGDSYSSQTIKATDANFFDEWSFVGEDSNSLVFTKVGEQKVYLLNEGYDGRFAITVNVTNKLIAIGPIYQLIENPLTGVKDIYVEQGYFGQVVAGSEINLEDYFLLLTFEGKDINNTELNYTEYFALTSAQLDYQKTDTTLGERSVNVYYPSRENAEYVLTSSVTVINRSVVGINIVSAPTKVEYVYTANGTTPLDTTGLKVSLVYDNDTSTILNVDEELDNGRLATSGFDSGRVGEQNIRVSYNYQGEYYEATFQVVVKDTTVVSMVWNTNYGERHNEIYWENGTMPSTEIPAGTEFDLGSITTRKVDDYPTMSLIDNTFVTITYDNGISETVALNTIYKDMAVVDYSKEARTVQYVKLYYGDAYVTIVTYISERKLASISLTEDSPQLAAIQGADVRLANAKLRLVYESGAPTIIPMSLDYINYDEVKNPNGYNKLTTIVGTYPVTIVYTLDGITKSCQVNITVSAPQLVKIEINDVPKIDYIEGEPFRADGQPLKGSIVLTYDNGNTEVKQLADATENSSSSTFNINTANFNSEEFTGYNKSQRITITYIFDEKTFTTGYNVIMHDRKYVETAFNAGNKYEFTYGEGEAPIVDLKGYISFNSANRELTIAKDDYKVKYVPANIWEGYGVASFDDEYTTFPTMAGEYYVVVYYPGDAIHNEFTDDSQQIIINKKALYISFEPISKVYGTENPELRLVLKSSKNAEVLDDPTTLFVTGDDFASLNFNASQVEYDTICYLVYGQTKLELNIFDIVFLNGSGEEITIDVNTNVSTYYVAIKTPIDSPNYEITYENATFEVAKRKVNIVPIELSYEYGEGMPQINYTATAVDGVEDSGVVNDDVFDGVLYRTNSENNNVGKYLITKGTLNNNNYEIIFVNQEGVDAKYIEITPRNVYARVNSTSIVALVDAMPTFSIAFYREDGANSEDAFAIGDSETIFKKAFMVSYADDVSLPGAYALNVVYNASVLTEDELAVVNNYNVIKIGGTLTVTKMPVTVTAIATSKEYGYGDPAFNYIVTVNEEIAAKLGYSELTEEVLATSFARPVSFTGGLARESGEEVGQYLINIGDLACEYFAINFVSAKFDITSMHVTISVADNMLTKAYDGQAPQIASYTLYDSNNGIIDDARVNNIAKAINFTFTNGSKNKGMYPVKVSSVNRNYDFKLQEEYTYEITRKVVSVAYVDLPNGAEYKGTAYVVSAAIPEAERAFEYNYDGTIKEDDDGNEVRDEVVVSLSLTSATAVGEYKTRAVSLSNDNYEIDAQYKEEVTFRIIPRKIYINLNTDASLVFEKEYDGLAAQIYANDCILKVNGEVVTNTVFGEPIPAFSLSVGNSTIAPSEVLYDSNGAIIAYSINIKENSSDKNFEFVLADEYKYMIIPKTVTISIPSNELYKEYDGQQPRIGVYTISETDANISSQSLTFNFSRETANDGKDNASVGNYGVTLTCSDKNYAVYLADTYVYSITKTTVAFSILSSSRTRAYNGLNASLTYSDINFPKAFSGNKPYVRNFVYGIGNADYIEFEVKLANITKMVTTAKSNVANVDYANIASQQLALETASASVYSAYYELYNRDNGYDKVITEENINVLKTNLLNAYNKLQNAISALNNSVQNAISEYLTAKSAVNSAFDIIEKENSYLAFIFGTEGTVNTKDKGSYIMQSIVKDYNREFTITGFTVDSNRTYTITAKTLSIKVDDIEVTYGDYGPSSPEPDIRYSLIDPITGLDYYLDVTGIPVYFAVDAVATGNPKRSDSDNYNAGEYNIQIGDVTISNTNYDLSILITAKYVIKQAFISIMLNDMGYGSEKVYYGDPIGMSNIGNSGYQYVEPTLEYTEKMAQLASISDSDSDIVKLEKLRETFGGLKNGESFNDIIKADLVKYQFYASENNKTSLLGEIVEVGEYLISATDIYTHKQPGAQMENYVVKVFAGSIKISRRPLTIKYQDSNRWLYKTYGDSMINIQFEGAIEDNLDKLTIYAIDSVTGELIPTSYKLGTFSFLSTNPDHLAANSYVSAPYAFATTGNETLPAYLDASGYCLKNYDFDIDSNTEYKVFINKAKLTLNVLSKNGTNKLSTVYGDVPDYRLSYSGLKNGETVEELGLDIGGEYAPVIDFKVMAGTYALGTNAVGNVISISFNKEPLNYVVDYIANTTVEIAKRTIYVYIDASRYADGKLPAMYNASNTGATITPYLVQIKYNKVTNGDTQTLEAQSAEIISGAYSYLDFRICTEDGREGLVTDSAYGDTIEDMFKKFASMSDATVGTTDPTGTTITIIGAYDKTYLHDVTVNFANSTAQLSGMTLSDKYKQNYDLKYKTMSINLYSHITELNVDASQYLIYGQDDARDVIKLNGVDELYNEHEFTISSPYISKTEQNLPTAANQNGYIKVKLDKSYVIYVQDANFIPVHEGLTARFGSTFSNNAVVSNKDIGEKTIIVRYYSGSKETIETVSPTFNNSLDEAVKYREALAEGVYTASNAIYDRINLTARFKVDNYNSEYSFKLLINGTFDSGLWIEFNSADDSYVTIFANYNGTAKEAKYKLFNTNLFDGNAHNIKVYLEKRVGTIRIAVDNKSGAIQTLTGIVNIIDDIVESSDVAFETNNLTMYLRKFSYATQGYNDNIGSFIRPQVDGENTLAISVSGSATSARISTLDMFDSAVPMINNYVIKYYVNNSNDPTIVRYGDTAAVLTLQEGKNAVVALLYEVNGDTETLLAKDTRYVSVSYAPNNVVITKDNSTINLNGNNVLRLFEKDNSYKGSNPDPEDVASYTGSAINYEIKATNASEEYMPISSLEVTMQIERTKFYNVNTGLVYGLPNTEKQYPISISMFNTVAWGDVTQIGSSGRGISLVLTRTQSENSKYTFTTDLVAVNKYVLSGSTTSQNGVYRFSQNIDYADGAIYTFGIYADRVGNASGNTNDMGALTGSTGVRVIIYRNGTPVADEYIDNSTVMKRGTSYSETAVSTTIDINSIVENAMKTGVTTHTSIYGFAHKLNVRNVVANSTSQFDNDYLVDGNYTMRNEADGNVIGNVTNTSVVAQSDARNNALLSNYNNILVKFMLNAKDAQDAGYEIDLKSIYSRLDTDSKRGVKLVATSEKLSFVFYDGENTYLAQDIDVSSLASGVLETGRLYTITASFDGVRRTTTSNIVRNGVSLTSFSESEGLILSYGAVTITISDGVNSVTSECYFPYFNSGYGWYTDIYSATANGGEGGYIVDTASVNYMKNADVRAIAHFVTNYSYSAITLNNVEITLYNYDTAKGNLIEDVILSTDSLVPTL